MDIFSEEYKYNIAQAWHNFVQNDCAISQKDDQVRQFVYDSWVRSKKYNVDPTKIITKVISPVQLDEILKKKEKLIAVAKPYMESIYSFLKGLNFAVALSDENGYVIYMLSDDDIISERTNASHLCLGSVRSEKVAGTNAFGTCLYLDRPLQLYGEEHYVCHNHTYVCAAAPIHDEANKIIGCLNFTGPREQANRITLSVVVSLVSGIENGMSVRSANEKLSILNTQLSTILQAINSGILTIDNEGFITQFNDTAAKLLNTAPAKMQGKNFFQFLSSDVSLFKNLTKNIINKEFDFISPEGAKISLSVSANMIFNDNFEKVGTVIVMEALKSVHKLVNRLSGFTANYTYDSIIGNSPEITNIKRFGEIASQSDVNVLILGESGTGKELMAQAIHNGSARFKGPFIAINCGSLPKGLIESELFGYEKGAFTGAIRDGKPGKFELADGGTIFLDEIGDMPLDLQSSLLRVIQSKEIVRIGGTQTKPVDVRVIAATNVDLEAAIANNSFRSDLYYRLNVFSIEMPALRDHPEDIPILSEFFIKFYSRQGKYHATKISPQAMECLIKYNWPGNVRELENTLERAINLSQADTIDVFDLPQNITSLPQNITGLPGAIYKPLMHQPHSRQNNEFDRLVEVLSKTYGNMTKTAKLLGISRRTLYYKMEKNNINPKDYR